MRSQHILIAAFVLLATFVGSTYAPQPLFGEQPLELVASNLIPEDSVLAPLVEKFVAFSAYAQTDAPFNASRTRTYKVCSDNACIVKKGKGISQCRVDADCKTSHTTCSGNRCILVQEPGTDECVLDQPCTAVSHHACRDFGLGPFCAAVGGPPRAGEVLCGDDDDCADDPSPSVPDLPPTPGAPPPNFCGSAGAPCQCIAGALPIDPSLVKRFNSTVHGEPNTQQDHGWAICGSGYCAVDLNVGATADEAFAVASRGVPIFSPINGTVTAADTGGRFGNCVIIVGGANAAALCHTVPSVSVGQTVTAGQQVATLKAYWGDFGPHLHFELKINGQWIMGDGKEGTWLNQQAALGCTEGASGVISPSVISSQEPTKLTSQEPPSLPNRVAAIILNTSKAALDTVSQFAQRVLNPIIKPLEHLFTRLINVR